MDAKPGFIPFAMCLLALGGGMTASHAALWAYDGFEAGGSSPTAGQYETGTGYGLPGDALVEGTTAPFDAQGPTTTGFSSGDLWQSGSFLGLGGFSSAVYYQASSTGLSYTDGSGNSLTTATGSIRHLHESTPAVKSIGRSLSGQPAPVGTEAWYSFMVRLESEDNNWNSTAGLALQQGVSADARHTGVRFSSTGQLEAYSSRNVAFSDFGSTLNANQDYFVLVRLEELAGSQDSMHVWLNPNLDAEPGLGTADASITGDFIYVGNNASYAFDTLGISATLDNSGAGNPEDFVFFDEFRLGSSFTDVTPYTPIPEPSSTLLMGLAGLGMIIRRRR